MIFYRFPNKIHTVWKSWREQYKATLTPVPYRPSVNSKRLHRLSWIMAITFKFILWAIAGLFLVFAIMLLPNLLWATAFFATALIVSPIVPVHWIAKLAIFTLIVLRNNLVLYSKWLLLLNAIVSLRSKDYLEGVETITYKNSLPTHLSLCAASVPNFLNLLSILTSPL